MIWSQITIPGKPRLLLIDGTRNAGGWEREFSQRMFTVFQRKGLGLLGETPIQSSHPQDLGEILKDQDAFNCLFLICHGEGSDVPEESKLAAYWDWLSHSNLTTPKLFAVCTFETPDPETSRLILSAQESFAKIAIVPGSSLSQRAAGLFYLKFFTELDLHADNSIMGKMVWFSQAKAKELLKKRNLPGQFEVRC